MRIKSIAFILLCIMMFPVTTWAGLSKTEISQLYVVLFNRASEGEGNHYWQTLDLDMATTADVMLETNAARNYFGTIIDSNQSFIEHIYLNSLNKPPAEDPDGIAYWVSLLDGGRSRGSVAASLVLSIQDYAPGGPCYNPSDTATISAYKRFTNRTIVSDYMADTVAEIPADWETMTQFGSSGLQVTDNDSTVTAAKRIINSFRSGSSGSGSARLMLNGRDLETEVEWQMTQEGLVLDIARFMQGIQGRFTPVNMNIGIVAQYGKRIGFSLNHYEYGMVQVQLCKMEPPASYENGVFWAPQGFLEAVVNGTLNLSETSRLLEVFAPEPQQIGDIIPAAAPLAQALEALDYTVQQGEICLSNAIDICFAGYSNNANGNNANFPYLCILAPQPPDADHAISFTQIGFSLREDEGLIIIGRTPPRCDYYSYRSYMLTRCLSSVNPFERVKIYTQLGDPINNYNILESLFYPPGRTGIAGPYESPFIIVSTPDRQLYQDVLTAASKTGLDPDEMLLDVIDHNLVRLGNDDFADTINFLHRFSNPKDHDAGETYVKRPTLEVLRLTPNKPRSAEFLTPFTARTRGSTVTEAAMVPAMEQLRQAIFEKYSSDFTISELETHVWLEKSGVAAIDALEDVLGETRDTLYLNSDHFQFNQDTIVIVYGVNHAVTPKSVYNNVSCYGAQYFNGFGGITNDMYIGSVEANFPSLSGLADITNLYVWKFARTQLDDNTFVVPQDINGDLKGINNGDDAFMVFRMYIDPDSPDLIGPDPAEIVWDQAMILTPKSRP